MQISIPKACNENWNEMTPEQQGAFCKVCSKVVIDFSKMSDEEIIRYFEKKKEEKTCGRFRVSQLSPYELKINLRSVATHKSFRKIFAASLFIIFSSLFVCKSDTGDTFVFNKLITDTADTSSVILSVDTLMAATDTTVQEIEVDVQEPMITGGVSVPVQLPPMDTLKPATDSVIIEKVPMLLGKVACTRPNKTNKPKTEERKTKGEVRIMGNLMF